MPLSFQDKIRPVATSTKPLSFQDKIRPVENTSVMPTVAPEEPQGGFLSNLAKGVAKGELALAKGLGTFGAPIAEKILPGYKAPDFYKKGTEQEKKATQFLTPQGTAQNVGYYGEKTLEFLAPSKLVTGAQKAVTAGVSAIPAVSKAAQFARGGLGVIGRAIPEAISAGVVSAANEGELNRNVASNAVISGGLSGTFGAIGALKRGAGGLDVTKNILSTTSGIPRNAIDVVAKNGVDMTATPEGALNASRTAVRTFRKNLSQMWQERLPQLADEFKGVRMGLGDTDVSKIAKVMDEFGLDEQYIPQNLKSMSVNESLDLMKGLNELNSKAVAMSPKGAIVRQLRDELRSKVLKNFGGNEGSVAKLWSEYGTKKGVHDSMDNIVRAYITNKPISDVTAKNRLMAIFDENKGEYLRAVQAIEKDLGVDLTSKVASTKFQNILPSDVMKVDGGLPTKAGIVNKIASLLLFPITSPRMVGKAVAPAKEAGAIGSRVFGNYQNNEPKAPNILENVLSSQNGASKVNATKSIIPQAAKNSAYSAIPLQKAGNLSSLTNSISTQPMNTPNAISKTVIPHTIPQKRPLASAIPTAPKNTAQHGQMFAGGAAGFGNDDQGNITFDIDKAMIGMAAMVGAQKLPKAELLKRIRTSIPNRTKTEMADFVATIKSGAVKTDKDGFLQFATKADERAFEAGMAIVTERPLLRNRLANSTLAKIANLYDEVLTTR